jgi:hypothetical protein
MTNICTQKFKHPPRLEAALMLRYASLLYEETENLVEMENTLSKGISLCDRVSIYIFPLAKANWYQNKLLDLKYTMRHLQARVTFRQNPKVAFRSLDSAIQEAEGYVFTKLLLRVANN